MVWMAGLEPAASGFQGRHSARLSYTQIELEPPPGFEPGPDALQKRCATVTPWWLNWGRLPQRSGVAICARRPDALLGATKGVARNRRPLRPALKPMAAGEAPALSLPTSTPPLTREAAEEYAPVAMLLLPCDEAEQQRMRRIHMAWATIDAGQTRRTDALSDALPARRQDCQHRIPMRFSAAAYVCAARLQRGALAIWRQW